MKVPTPEDILSQREEVLLTRTGEALRPILRELEINWLPGKTVSCWIKHPADDPVTVAVVKALRQYWTVEILYEGSAKTQIGITDDTVVDRANAYRPEPQFP
jgi:hypothetical protein